MRTIAAVALPLFLAAAGMQDPPQNGNDRLTNLPEAPAAYDSETNGFSAPATFEADKEVFEELELIEDGLGPVFNAQGCVECHQTPVTGGASQVTELRAGRRRLLGGFVEPPGGSLINDRAIDVKVQEVVPGDAFIRTLRASLNVLGDGFVEAIPNETIQAIAAKQRRDTLGRIAGEVIFVPVLEAPGTRSIGRFGWKNQHASLMSFAADAYLNEMGITTPFLPKENTSLGRSVAQFDHVPDPEDDGEDVEIFARFMRATKAPPRDATLASTPQALAGARVFEVVGCAHCHVATIATAAPGTVIHGGFTVPDALGGKLIHPFSDYLLHDVGTGDGIVQNGPPSTANKLRTAPLWGIRARARLMHDGASLTVNDAILRHGGESAFVTRNYRFLPSDRRRELLAFLASL